MERKMEMGIVMSASGLGLVTEKKMETLIHDRADSVVASTCFYIAEDVEYSEAHFHWPG